MAEGKVRFIRVRGRVVPVKGDAVKYMSQSAKSDRALSKTGKKVALASAAGAAGAAALGKLAKFKGAYAAAGMMAGFSLLNASFAEGRSMSASDRAKYADQLKKGKKIRRGSGIGGASDRAYHEAKFLSVGSKIKKANRTGLK